MNVQSCCFACLNLLLFCCSQCRRRRRCLDSLLGSLSNDDADVNENRKKAKAYFGKTTILHVHHAFLHISLPSLHGYDVKMPDFTFCGGREHKATTIFFFFF